MRVAVLPSPSAPPSPPRGGGMGRGAGRDGWGAPTSAREAEGKHVTPMRPGNGGGNLGIAGEGQGRDR